MVRVFSGVCPRVSPKVFMVWVFSGVYSRVCRERVFFGVWSRVVSRGSRWKRTHVKMYPSENVTGLVKRYPSENVPAYENVPGLVIVFLTSFGDVSCIIKLSLIIIFNKSMIDKQYLLNFIALFAYKSLKKMHLFPGWRYIWRRKEITFCFVSVNTNWWYSQQNMKYKYSIYIYYITIRCLWYIQGVINAC